MKDHGSKITDEGKMRGQRSEIMCQRSNVRAQWPTIFALRPIARVLLPKIE